MARFFRSDAEEIAAEMMNDADSDDVDIYMERRKKKVITFQITPCHGFLMILCHNDVIMPEMKTLL